MNDLTWLERFPKGGGDVWDTPNAGTILTAEAFGVSSLGGLIKVFIQGAWSLKPVKVWLGNSWVTKPLKRWAGTSWTTT